jgi:hypothetical protein
MFLFAQQLTAKYINPRIVSTIVLLKPRLQVNECKRNGVALHAMEEGRFSLPPIPPRLTLLSFYLYTQVNAV